MNLNNFIEKIKALKDEYYCYSGNSNEFFKNYSKLEFGISLIKKDFLKNNMDALFNIGDDNILNNAFNECPLEEYIDAVFCHRKTSKANILPIDIDLIEDSKEYQKALDLVDFSKVDIIWLCISDEDNEYEKSVRINVDIGNTKKFY